MKAMFWMRMLAWIKRGVIALESIAKSQAAIAEVAVAKTKPTKKPRMAEVFTATIPERNAAWQQARDADVYGETGEPGDGA